MSRPDGAGSARGLSRTLDPLDVAAQLLEHVDQIFVATVDVLRVSYDRIALGREPGQEEHRESGAEADEDFVQLDVVIDAIKILDDKDASVETSVVFDLVRQLTGRRASELTAARAELERLATGAKQPMFRQIGFVSLVILRRKSIPRPGISPSSGTF